MGGVGWQGGGVPMADESPRPGRPRAPRKHAGFLGPLIAWLEERKVCRTEMDLFETMHRNQWLRPRVEEKLRTLDLAVPMEGDLFLRVKRALELFEAVDAGEYPRPMDWDRLEPELKRALTYFVQAGDAIPDHHADGYDDDHREFLEMGERLGPVLEHFAAWQARREFESLG